ncbi:MAG TPA: hypothetical protein VKB88_30115 [Bryobacteraceae bacterium]|nr:hypothetical protein [Bryobacteraceae bacterium]
MDWLEEELKRALAREEPPPGFEFRVWRRLKKTFPRWLAAAAALLLVAGGAEAWHWHQGRMASRQVMLAMRLAGEKLNLVQTHLRRQGR